MPYGCIVSSMAGRQPIFNTDDHAAKGLMAGHVPRIPSLSYPGKLSDGYSLLELYLERHPIQMVADDFLKTLST